MRILAVLSIILMIFFVAANSLALEHTEASKLFSFIQKKKWGLSYNLASKSKDPILRKIVLSQQYLDPNHNGNSFEKITKFLQENPYWPQDYLLKLRAESYLNCNTNKQLIVNWFKKNPPITAKGHKYYALASSNIVKNKEELTKIIKSGWHYGNFTLPEQKEYHKKFKPYLTKFDHIKKIDNHLSNEEFTNAKNSFYLVDAGYKKSFEAQIAITKKEHNAKSLFRKVQKKYYTAGLVYNYLNSIKSSNPKSSDVVSMILAVRKNTDYGDRISKVQLYLAREYIEKKRYKDAYDIASVSFAESASDKSDAEFMSGWLALRFLKKPGIALSHFQKFNNLVKTPMSKSRGVYWMARANEDCGNKDLAIKQYRLLAKKYSYTFYGQMGLVELKENKISLPSELNIKDYKQLIASQAKNHDIAKATKIMSKYGSNNLGRTYIKHAIEKADNHAEIMNIADHISDSDNVHHKAWMGKTALQKHAFIQSHTYPVPYKFNDSPVEKPLVYSIIRQESVFEHGAVSIADARGLMQLKEATACDTASKISVRCQPSKLREDKAYNIKLGSNHLRHLLDDYKGSYILTIAAYNAGPHPVNKWLKKYGDPRKMKNVRDVVDWMEMIPFYETRNYVQRVLENLQIYRTIINRNNKLDLRADLLSDRRKK